MRENVGSVVTMKVLLTEGTEPYQLLARVCVFLFVITMYLMKTQLQHHVIGMCVS